MKKNYPQVKFISNALADAKKIVFAAIGIKEGFYQSNDYQIVTDPEDIIGKKIIFPDFCTKVIPDFWEKLPPHCLYPKKVDKIVHDLTNYIDRNSLTTDFKFLNHLQSDWKRIDQKFWATLEEIIPKTLLQIRKFTIEVTRWGYILSFGSKNNIVFKPGDISLRYDGSNYHLARGLISTLLWDELSEQQYSYEGQIAISDFILSATKFKELFSNYEAFHIRLNRADYIDGRYAHGSIAEIGLHRHEIISWRGDDLFFNKKPPKHKLSKDQLNILIYLRENNGRVCTYKELARIVWPNNCSQKFSLWAINSLIYRLRKKLTQNKIDPKIVETIRGQGFRLNDF